MSPESAVYWMERCLSLAANADSSTSPNPRVGCVILSPEGKLLGEGWHRYVGGPHAEDEAITQVQSRYGAQMLQGATLVVNLEPCNHHGRRPPCTQSIMDVGINKVVVGMCDPNPKAGGGIDRLRAENVEVITDVLKAECYRFNEAFFHWHTRKMPFITLKIAQTLDGCIATEGGESRWITGKEARKYVHIWRRETDAVLIGSGTARTDNPSLTVRHVSGSQPWRIVLDTDAALPSTLKLFTDSWKDRTISVVTQPPGSGYRQRCGHLIVAESSENRILLLPLIQRIGKEMNIQSILVEAGSGLASAFLKQNLVDRLRIFIAPKLLGDGLRAFDGLGIRSLAESTLFQSHTWDTVGEDVLFTGYKHKIPDMS